MLTVERNVKFRSSQTEVGLCIVESVMLSEDRREDIKLIRSYLRSLSCFSFFTVNDNSRDAHYSMRS